MGQVVVNGLLLSELERFEQAAEAQLLAQENEVTKHTHETPPLPARRVARTTALASR